MTGFLLHQSIGSSGTCMYIMCSIYHHPTNVFWLKQICKYMYVYSMQTFCYTYSPHPYPHPHPQPQPPPPPPYIISHWWDRKVYDSHFSEIWVTYTLLCLQTIMILFPPSRKCFLAFTNFLLYTVYSPPPTPPPPTH